MQQWQHQTRQWHASGSSEPHSPGQKLDPAGSSDTYDLVIALQASVLDGAGTEQRAGVAGGSGVVKVGAVERAGQSRSGQGRQKLD